MNNSEEKQEFEFGQEPEYIPVKNWDVEKLPWHPDLTQEQIAYALMKDIPEPKGPEYEQFLMELGLKPIKERSGIIPTPTPTPWPIPTPVPTPTPRPTPTPVPTPTPRPTPTPGPTPTPRPTPTPGPTPTPRPTPAPRPPIQPEDLIETIEEEEKQPIPPVPPVIPEDKTEKTDEDKKEEEENFQKVIRVEKNFKNRLSAFLLATSILAFSYFGLVDKPIEMEEIKQNSTIDGDKMKYSIIEYIREHGYEDRVVENIIYKFASDYGFKIGDSIKLDQGTDAYYYGNLTGNNITIQGDQVITGFCLYCRDDIDKKYEYSFYEDRSLDGTPDRTSVGDFEGKIDTSINDFLSRLDTENYDLDNIGFSLHFGKKGWTNFDNLIKVTDEKETVNVQELVEICKEGATYDGVLDDIESKSISITASDGSEVVIPIFDEDNQQLYQDGTHVIGSDGREYIISDLEIVSEPSFEDGNEENSKAGLKCNITDCELAVGLAPLIAAAGFAIASKIRNDKYKKDPNFFEFENEKDYVNFKKDFEKAREERNSKFGQILKNAIYGETVNVEKIENEEQIQEIYSTIRNTHNGDYSYSPSDKIQFRDGHIFAVSPDGRAVNVTHLVSDIGVENPKNSEGLLTEDVIEKHGGGHRK